MTISLYLVRHAEKKYSNGKMMPFFDPPLTKKGLSAAARFGETANLPNNAVIISSPYARCMETAAAIRRNSNVRKPVVSMASVGEYLGPKWKDVDVLTRGIFLQPSTAEFADILPQPGEDWQSLQLRGKDALARIMAATTATGGSVVVVVSHGVVIDSIAAAINGILRPEDRPLFVVSDLSSSST